MAFMPYQGVLWIFEGKDFELTVRKTGPVSADHKIFDWILKLWEFQNFKNETTLKSKKLLILYFPVRSLTHEFVTVNKIYLPMIDFDDFRNSPNFRLESLTEQKRTRFRTRTEWNERSRRIWGVFEDKLEQNLKLTWNRKLIGSVIFGK